MPGAGPSLNFWKAKISFTCVSWCAPESTMPKKTKGSTAKAKAKTAVLGKSPAKAAKASASSGSGGLLVTIEACKT